MAPFEGTRRASHLAEGTERASLNHEVTPGPKRPVLSIGLITQTENEARFLKKPDAHALLLRKERNACLLRAKALPAEHEGEEALHDPPGLTPEPPEAPTEEALPRAPRLPEAHDAESGLPLRQVDFLSLADQLHADRAAGRC